MSSFQEPRPVEMWDQKLTVVEAFEANAGVVGDQVLSLLIIPPAKRKRHLKDKEVRTCVALKFFQ